MPETLAESIQTDQINPAEFSNISHASNEAIHKANEVYRITQEYVAPVIIGFADDLLRTAGDRQILFAARDGLAPYMAAKRLKEKFDYQCTDPDQLVYGYLTRRVMGSAPHGLLAKYLEQIGIHSLDSSLILADVGMYGTILHKLREILPRMEAHYLISKTPQAKGYMDGEKHRMNSLHQVIGNPAVHFLEDTYSGPIRSPHGLVEVNGQILPDTYSATYSDDEAIVRSAALQAIDDYAATIQSPPDQSSMESINKLDALLSNPNQYKGAMIPHE